MSELDRLASRLDNLDGDLSALPLPPVDQLRRRGDRRDRARVAAASVATLALVGVLSFVVHSRLGPQALYNGPATTVTNAVPSPTAGPVTPTTGPTSSSSPLTTNPTGSTGSSRTGRDGGPAPLSLPDAFLPAAQLPVLHAGDSAWTRTRTDQGASYWAEWEANQKPSQLRCWFRPMADPAQEGVAGYELPNRSSSLLEVLSAAGSETTAQDSLQQLRDRCGVNASTRTTDPGKGETIERISDLTGETGFVYSMNSWADTELYGDYAIVLQRGRLLVVLAVDDQGLSRDLPRAALVNAAVAAMDRAEQR